jgi:hypothetical protein
MAVDNSDFSGLPATMEMDFGALFEPDTPGNGDQLPPYGNWDINLYTNWGIDDTGLDDMLPAHSSLVDDPENCSEILRSPLLEPAQKTGVDAMAASPLDYANSTQVALTARRKGRASRLTQHQTRTLKHWLMAHLDDPYPSDNEKAALQEEAGLSKKQVQDWLARIRYRQLQPSVITRSNGHEGHDPRSEEVCISVEVLASSLRAFSLRSLNSENDYWIDQETVFCSDSAFRDPPYTLLDWWMGSSLEKYHGYCFVGEFECHAAILTEIRLKHLAQSLAGRGLSRLDTRNTEERALLRLLDLLDAGIWATHTIRRIITAFKTFGFSITYPVVHILNAYDCRPNVPMEIGDIIAVTRDCVSPNGEWIPGSMVLLRSALDRISNTSVHLQTPIDFPPTVTISNPARPLPSVTDLLNCPKRKRQEGTPGSPIRDEDSHSLSEAGSFGADSASSSSASSVYSSCSYTSHGRRRGRKLPRINHDEKSGTGEGEVKLRRLQDVIDSIKPRFKCQYCAESFTRASTRRRHEESIHVTKNATRRWICEASPLRVGWKDTVPCQWCPLQDESLFTEPCDHDQRADRCWVKPLESRTFFRKDLFIQHLKGPHKAGADSLAVRMAHIFERISFDSAEAQPFAATSPNFLRSYWSPNGRPCT